MTKVELIAKYGQEWYERFKEKSRIRSKSIYDADPEAERERRRRRYANNPEKTSCNRRTTWTMTTKRACQGF